MSIHLGLGRIRNLLAHLGDPHIASYKSVHVAGTNGKGSTVAYLSSILTKSNIRNGRFTSPHLVTYNDCICINDQTYSAEKFEKIRNLVVSSNRENSLECTEFEVLTATAFKIFELEKVELALIEVGLGGRLDATNVLLPWQGDRTKGGVIVCGITKIGMDHEGLLGDTIEAISREKAGIIKRSIPVIVDHTNQESVLEEIRKKAQQENAVFILTSQPNLIGINHPIQYSPLLGEYQVSNLLAALQIVDQVRLLMPQLSLTKESIIAGIKGTLWPGRLQKLTDPLANIEFLLDGAHNESAATELGKYLRKIRQKGFIFVIAMTEGKSLDGLLRNIVSKEEDAIIPFEFSLPEGMPWVKCQKATAISKVAQGFSNEILETKSFDVSSLFELLSERISKGDDRKIVICGSLYLCSDILRYQKSKKV